MIILERTAKLYQVGDSVVFNHRTVGTYLRNALRGTYGIIKEITEEGEYYIRWSNDSQHGGPWWDYELLSYMPPNNRKAAPLLRQYN